MERVAQRGQDRLPTVVIDHIGQFTDKIVCTKSICVHRVVPFPG
jgi:hypothetical protein